MHKETPFHDADGKWLSTRNSARFFVEHPQIGWVLLVATLLWGIWAWQAMPQRKDPEIAVRSAAVVVSWPGAPAVDVEARLTRRIEEAIGGNKWVNKIESVSRTGLVVTTFQVHERMAETDAVLDDIGFRLQSVTPLPEGASKLVYIKDFGDTATLMLTVASPLVDDVELEARAQTVAQVLAALRAEVPSSNSRTALVWIAPDSVQVRALEALGVRVSAWLDTNYAVDVHYAAQQGLLLVDMTPTQPLEAIQAALDAFVVQESSIGALHPEMWKPALVADATTQSTIQSGELEAHKASSESVYNVSPKTPRGAQAQAESVIQTPDTPETSQNVLQRAQVQSVSQAAILEALQGVAGERYSWRELESFTERIRAALSRLESVGRVSRWGVRPETIFVDWSQERLAALGMTPEQIAGVLAARNTSLPGGVVEASGRGMVVAPEGELQSAQDVSNVLLMRSSSGSPLYLRDVAEVTRAYRTPADNVNHFMYRDEQGVWQQGKAITLAIEMRSGEQIAVFSREVDAALDDIAYMLPDGLLLERTSDQPRQVIEKVSLFTLSLWEAVILVVAVAFIGFREWRSALLMALSIPLTLAMTFGMMHLLGIDLQQISIASLILALGLLVDDPVVAGDAIKREIAAGRNRILAAWLGPTKLARAILYATITNIVAYLPFLLLTGDKGRFLYSMPVVVTCSLVASRLVSMTFIPLIGAKLLDAGRHELILEERRTRGIGKFYYAVGGWAIDHRWKVLLCSLLFIAAGCWVQTQLKPHFFPKDRSYLSFVDVWLPEDSTVEETQRMAEKAAHIIAERIDAFDVEQGRLAAGEPASLHALTLFVGGGGPRFWFSVTPELQQPNYAQILIEVSDNHLTSDLVPLVQQALDAKLSGALADVRELETGMPIGVPVQFRLYGDDMAMLRHLAESLEQKLRTLPLTERVRNNWGAEAMISHLQVDADKAALAGVSMQDIARTLEASTTGTPVTLMQDGRVSLPIMLRLRPEERVHATDIEDVYVAGAEGVRVPLAQFTNPTYSLGPARLYRRNQQRAIVVSCFPREGVLPSEIIQAMQPEIDKLHATLPAGFRLELGGEHEEQVKGFKELAGIMAIAVGLIYLALLCQFRNAVKPLIVFASIPYGIAGAFMALAITGQPFGFMAFLGIASLIGVIVSHIIVLFDFIEERREEGEDLRTALLDAGIVRLRPVMITVAATVFALFPLAFRGGVLWEPLCFAQAGGLTVATFITLLMVPVLYAISVLDLKIVK